MRVVFLKAVLVLLVGSGTALVGPAPVAAAPRLTPAQAAFLARVAGPARASQRAYGVPASVVIAQAVLESGWGASALTRDTNNYFGMTCAAGRRGPVAVGCLLRPDHVCDAGGCRASLAEFRVYRSAGDSFRDHGRQFASGRRYAKARAQRRNPNRFVVEVQRAGYATNPRYAQLLTRIMVKFNLYRFNAR
jgi:flagellum-specific peptidoglycan hydrolase FlgJ